MPIVDNIESKTTKDSDGQEVTNWFLIKNPQFRHLNLCLNDLDEMVLKNLEMVYSYTADDFCITLSGNPMPEETIEQLYKHIKAEHKRRIMEQRMSEPGSQVHEVVDIAQRRAAFWATN